MKFYDELGLVQKEDGWYDESNCYYENLEQALTGVLGFCGCGMPDAALGFVYKALNQLKIRKELLWEEKISWEEWEGQNRAVFGDRGVEYFTWYFLDDKGLTEHGGSVPGWITDKGQQLMELLEIYLKEEEFN